ncbi:MAG: riboflavin synthase [Thiobacillaceae bacterium]|nr:riboflavin synthase [Thiobacillaceae bacterium]MCX7673527.1 riboflavin synthase [Thiobacillaceae bacterium]MDW8324245.1 riboflavin synthase [Burkholderiales bacterium]
MFTGIIQAIGHIQHLTEANGGDARVTIAGGGLDLSDVAIGDSIAVNGVCLTVIERTPTHFSVDVSQETFACTVGFAPGDAVNLEKALRAGDRLGGHLVTGHVDGVGEVTRAERVGESLRLDIRVPPGLERYIAVKGSIAVNGVSLTVNRVHGAEFSVNLIPHTQQATTLKDLGIGDRVNLEVDILARYAERLLSYASTSDKD